MPMVDAPQTSTWRLSTDLVAALDPVVFAHTLGIAPDPWQGGILRSDHPRVLMNCSRQSGKSTAAAIVGLHRAVYYPASLVLLMSPSLRQSSELFRSVARLYQGLGETVLPKAESALRLELGNGSRIISLPATAATIRGYSGVNLLVVDEASRVPDELFLSVRPMLATSKGRLVALSTPWGRRGWWSEAWHDGGDRWTRVEVMAEQCPRISPAFLAEERESMGEFWYRQEYGCEFLDSDTQAFSTQDIEQAEAGEIVETWTL